MDTPVASELLIALTSLAGHLESLEDPKSAGCGPGFGFFQERDRAPLSLAGTREASSGAQGRNGKEDGMWKHEAGLRVAPETDITPRSRRVAAVGRVLSRWPPGFNCAKSEPCLRLEQFPQARGGRPAPSGLRVSQ